jgi:hypothetical protein
MVWTMSCRRRADPSLKERSVKRDLFLISLISFVCGMFFLALLLVFFRLTPHDIHQEAVDHGYGEWYTEESALRFRWKEKH